MSIRSDSQVPSISSAAWDPRATEPRYGNLALDLPFHSGFLLQQDSSEEDRSGN
jgi:hypothetical protein